VPGTYILTDELNDLKLSLVTMSSCLDFFQLPAAQDFVYLKALAGEIEIPRQLLREAERIMDDKGQLKDSASAELSRIRKEIRLKTLASEKVIGQMMSMARSSGWTSSDAEVTLREGRMVIPLLVAHKRRVKGIIHDESASGQTVYVEPESCLEINNEVRELESAERREIIHILTLFSDFLRPEIPVLLQAYDFLGEIDFIRAKARLAVETESDLPMLGPKPAINWTNARHPLLNMALRSKSKTIVPLNIKLDRQERILVITGPNAGGKSVCLKTVGLIQYMLQTGLLVPLHADSKAGIFERIFIDIGDEQSLENDLSTYSSHLLNLQFFLTHCNPDSLFLVDELGTGTDPSLGGAIAEASLERLSETGSFGVVTTHYSNLKLLAGKVPGIMNGAMLFDTNNLKPLYILAAGKPGSSFTFEIARRIGFPEDVIASAIEKTGKTHLDFEQQLQEVESEKLMLEKRLKEFQIADGFLGELIEKYETLKKELEESRKGILEKARREAGELLDRSNRIIEGTIKQIKESEAEKTKTKDARWNLEQFRQALEQKNEDKAVPSLQNQQKKPELKAGNWVILEGQNRAGQVKRLKGEEATVDFEGITLKVPVSKLTPCVAPVRKSPAKKNPYMRDYNEKAINFKLTLDLRGKTAEEAIMMTRKYLDDAYLLRIKEVSLLHGKGEGILRKAIRDLLSESDIIESYEDEQPERGGTGITRVALK
jgi:DNA mismatch repair protein MutS2